MPNRIDALPKQYPGLMQLRGAVLGNELDPELQALTAQTCVELAAPMAAVSLMLEHVQLFRAAHGLPPDLEASRATGRDASFCQFVVRDDELFEVTDAATDTRVPQELVIKYGIGSYLGAPIRLGGETVGSMCVIDRVPRMFSARDRETLVRHAATASRRLELLAAQPRDRERALHERAVRPAFGELRNRLTPVLGNISLMQVALSELAAVHRLMQYVAETGDVSKLLLLSRTTESMAELQESLDDIASDTQAIARSIVALERASTAAASGCPLADVIDAASTLAHHRTKLVGGVRLPEAVACTLQTPRPVAISALSAALSELADALAHDRRSTGISLIVTRGESEVRVQMFADVTPVVFDAVADHLRLLLADTMVIVDASERGLDIIYPLQVRRVVSAHGPWFHELDRSPA